MIRYLLLSLAVVVAATPLQAGQKVCVKQVAAVSHVATPVLAVVPPVYATVGAGYQAEAQATAGFRQSAEYLEYQRLIGYRLAMEQVFPAGVPVETVPEEAAEPATEAFDAPKVSEVPAAAPTLAECPSVAPAAAPTVPEGAWPVEFTGKYPLLAANCMNCHVSSESKGGFNLAEAISTAKRSGDCETLRETALMVLEGSMPPKSTLPPEVRAEIARNILAPPQ